MGVSSNISALPAHQGRRAINKHYSVIDKQGSTSAVCVQELEHHHGPPRVDQHDKGKHPERKTLFFARLLITDTQVLHESLEFILGSFHISKVIHGLISFDSYDEDPGRMSLLLWKILQGVKIFNPLLICFPV